MLSKEFKEQILQQRGAVVWFTGLPRSGKTTLAEALSENLTDQGFFCQVLDGDRVRQGISSDLGYSLADREENIRRVAEICRILTDNGIVVVCSFVSPTEKIRNRARKIIGENHFIEVFVSTPVAICEERDKTGLYKKSRSGEVKDFTGISSPFEIPSHPDIIVDTTENTIEGCVGKILEKVLPHIRLIP